MGMMGAHTHPKPPKAKPKPRNGKEGDPNHELQGKMKPGAAESGRSIIEINISDAPIENVTVYRDRAEVNRLVTIQVNECNK